MTFFLRFLLLLFISHVYVCGYGHLNADPLSMDRRGHRSPGTVVIDGCESPEESTGNMGPLLEQHVSLTSEPSPQTDSQVLNGVLRYPQWVLSYWIFHRGDFEEFWDTECLLGPNKAWFHHCRLHKTQLNITIKPLGNSNSQHTILLL